LPGVFGHLESEGRRRSICQLSQTIQHREFQLQLDAINHGFEADFNVVEFVLGYEEQDVHHDHENIDPE
jgi:hypothetical protein